MFSLEVSLSTIFGDIVRSNIVASDNRFGVKTVLHLPFIQCSLSRSVEK